MIKVQRESKSRLVVEVVTTTDPEAATVFFAFPIRGERPDNFIAGNWNGDGVSQNGFWVREAITPRIGEGSLDLGPGHYRLFGKVVLGNDEDVWEIDEEGLEVQ